MRDRHGRAALFLMLALLWSVQLCAIQQGQPLGDALEELRRAGLQLVFSSALVEPSFTVSVDAGHGSAEAIARRILAPYGLTLDSIRPGLFAIVRREANTNDAGVIEIRVEEPDGQPISNAAVTLSNRRLTVRTDARGVALFSGLDPGHYDVIGTASGFVDSQLRGLQLQRAEKLRLSMPLAPVLGPLLEVDVYASRYAVDRQHPTALAELTREDLVARPGLDQDALRVTQYLPGTASNALSARTHVRGGRDDEVAVYFDGVQLFEPFHYKDVQSFLGILDPGAISSVDFFSGVFPTRFGNRLSGVLDIRPRAWSGQNAHEVGASVLYTHVLSQGRVGDWPVEWLMAVRRSNIELLADVLARGDIEPTFLDGLGRVQFDVGERSKIALGWLVLNDTLSANLTSSGEQAEIGYRDATGYVSWQFQPNESLETRASAAVTERHTARDGTLRREQNVQASLVDRRRFDTMALRLENNLRLSDRWSVESGAELYDYEAEYAVAGSAQFDPVFAAALGRPNSLLRETNTTIEGKAYAGYVSVLTSLPRDISLDVGLRWDAQRYGSLLSDEQYSPRVSLKYNYDSATVFRVGWGSLAQAQRPDELPVQDGETQFSPAQRARQTVASVERRMSGDALMRFELFDKRIARPKPEYENLLDPFALVPELEIDRVRIAPDRARAYGAELSLRWDSQRTWSSWASYSLARAFDYFDGVAVPRTWEQKHSFVGGVAWTARPWTLSANANWHTGWRRNQLTVASVDAGGEPVLALAPRNQSTWGSYFSLDFRASWAYRLTHGSLESFVELDNATNHGNLCCVNYELADASSPSSMNRLNGDSSTWLPRFVLLGLTWQLP